MKGKIVVVGSSNTDMVVNAHKIPAPGETIMGSSFSVIPGGKGANQAVAAARAGADVIFIAKTGSDEFGQQAIEGYQEEHINTNFILQDQDTPSGIALIIVDDYSGQNSIVVAPGSNSKLTPQEIIALEEEIAGADVLLVQLEIPLGTVQKSLEIAHYSEVLTILNPAPAQKLDDDWLGLVDIITPNETETKLLTGIDPCDEDSIRAAGKELLRKIKHTVIITRGEHGVYYISKNGAQGFLKTNSVKALDTTAAGDVFNGYLAAALSQGENLEAAMKKAMKAATLSVCKKGAQTSIPFANEL
ncbi:MAG: ribokinase [Saprospiraceae bacterium]|nr:ribokinase [Saprospiraceae bacterium]